MMYFTRTSTVTERVLWEFVAHIIFVFWAPGILSLSQIQISLNQRTFLF